MFIDSHLHIAEESSTDVDKIITNAKENNVEYLIISGTNKEDNLKNIEIANKYNNIFITLGYHPCELNSLIEEDLEILEEQIKNTKNVVAIGEIGLDFYYGKENKEKQIIFFKKQLNLATKYNLPIVIHMRDASSEVLNIIENYDLKGVFHCFSGSTETAKKIVNNNFYLGIGGILTFSNSNLRNVIKDIDLNNIILETDSPYLSPLRGKKNEPKNIKIIAETLAELKGVSLEKVGKITTKNAFILFDLENKI